MAEALTKTTLVLGIGNALLADDGAGVHTIAYLRNTQRELSAGVRLIDGGTLSFVFMEAIEGADEVIVVDAAELGESPGTVRELEGEAMDRFLRSPGRSAHQVGLADILELSRLRGWVVENRALVAIQPGRVAWGNAPSPAVARAIPEAAASVVRLVQHWRNGHRIGGRA